MKTAPAAAAPLPMALPTAATLASRALDLSALPIGKLVTKANFQKYNHHSLGYWGVNTIKNIFQHYAFFKAFL